MSKSGVALRRFSYGDNTVAKGDVVKGLPANQFADFEAAGLIRPASKDDLGSDEPKKASDSK